MDQNPPKPAGPNEAADPDFEPFNIPGFSGDTCAAFPNTDLARAPFVAMLDVAPGAVLKHRWHTQATEAVYVVPGTLINDGEHLEAGSFLVDGPGMWHGPRSTDEGCRPMFIQHPGVGPEDSVFVDD